MTTAAAHRWPHVVVALASIVGIAGVFLPFTYDTSPWSVVFDDGLWMLATPFFLSFALAAASMAMLTAGTLSPPGRVVAIASGAAMTLVTLVGMYTLVSDESLQTLREWTAAAMAPVGAILWLVIVRGRGRQDSGAIAALALPYVVNVAFCLVIFPESWQLGAYCGLAAAVLYAVPMVTETLSQAANARDRAVIDPMPTP